MQILVLFRQAKAGVLPPVTHGVSPPLTFAVSCLERGIPIAMDCQWVSDHTIGERSHCFSPHAKVKQ